MTGNRLVGLWLPVALWAGLIFALSSVPGLHSGSRYDFILRKCAHVTEYFVLAGLTYRAFKGSFAPGPRTCRALSAAASIAYAASDEIHQIFVPHRGPSPSDVLIDTAGVAAFFLALKILEKRKNA